MPSIGGYSIVTAKLISAQELYDHINDNNYLIFDVRNNLTDPQFGRNAYNQGHIPGALFLDSETELCSARTGTNGRHPLPDRTDFARFMQSRGLKPGVEVIIYDAGNSAFAARLWWMLRWLGHDAVAILDGGWQAWQAIDGPASTEIPVITDLAEQPELLVKPAMPIVDARNILSNLDEHRFTVLDARGAERFQGKTEPMDPVAGHIPGAMNRPFTDNLQADNCFKPASQLRTEFETLLGKRLDHGIVHQCGSGVTACHNLFAMELAGLRGSALYPGSWSEWCSDPNRPVARGASISS